MSGWQPIETVPKDGTPVDLWGIVSDDYDEPRSERWTDARWVFGRWVGPWSDGFESGLPDDRFTPTHWAYPPLDPAASPPQPDALKLVEEELAAALCNEDADDNSSWAKLLAECPKCQAGEHCIAEQWRDKARGVLAAIRAARKKP